MVWKPSPNFTGGRQGQRVDRIVVHWIVGNISAADAVFAKAGNASAHYAIENATIHQYVKESDTAYHSGDWGMNLRSVGIEHSAAPDRPASEATYQTSAKLIAEICKRHGIPCDRTHIIKHNQVVSTQCPGTINIDRLVADAAKHLGGTVSDELSKANHYNKLEAVRGLIFRITGLVHDDADITKNHFGSDARFTPTEQKQLSDKFFRSNEYLQQGITAYEEAYGKADTSAKKDEYRTEVRKKADARIGIPTLYRELLQATGGD